MTAPGEITAVVVDWNLPDYTIRCVESLVGDGLPLDRIVVVENGPTGENWSRVRGELSGCVLVRIETNLGFARANNIGARSLPGGAYLFVNNDALVHRAGAVSALGKALERAGVGIVVPKLLNADLTLQPSVVPFTTPLTALVRASGMSRFLPDRWQPRLSTHWSHGRSREIQAATGAVLLVDGGVWDRLGGFSEASFMYAEDLDLCWRVHEDGGATWFCAESEFVHLGGASSDRRWTNRDRWAEIGRAESAMIREHLSPARAAVTLGIMRAGLAARVACFSVAGKHHEALSCKGFLAGLGEGFHTDVMDRATLDPAIEIQFPRD